MEKKKTNQRDKAEKIEKEITSMLSKFGEAVFVNSNYDILFLNIPIEVKSSELCIFAGMNGTKTQISYRRPYFKITKFNHQLLLEKEGYYCLVITFKERIILELFIQANKIVVKENKSKDYFFINSEIMYDENMLTLDQFIQQVAVQKHTVLYTAT